MSTSRMGLGVLLLAWSAAGWGQSTVKDIGDAKPMSAAELKDALPGSIYQGADAAQTWEYTLEKNGRVIGTLTGRMINPVAGSWSVNDAGLACFDVSASGSRNQLNSRKCHFIYHVGDAYYASDKAEPDAPLLKVRLQR